MKRIRTINLAVAAALTASANAASVDLKAAGIIDGQGRFVRNSSLTGAAGNTSDTKIQDSADNITFADVTGLVFPQVTNTTGAGVAEIVFDVSRLRRYVRVVDTLTGTVVRSVMLVGQKKYTP